MKTEEKKYGNYGSMAAKLEGEILVGSKRKTLFKNGEFDVNLTNWFWEPEFL